MADERTYIRVHDGIEDHPKTAALSDKAFRLLVTTWGWCSRHLTDGCVPLPVWKQRGTPKARRELVTAHLVEVYDDHVVMHDYLEHQRSAEEVAEKREARRRAGALGNHNRWHVGKKLDPECPICVANGPQPPSQKGSHLRSQKASQDDRKTSPEAETETETETETDLPVETSGREVTQVTRGRPPSPQNFEVSRPADRCAQHTGIDNPPPCGLCADARRAAERWDAEQPRRQAEARSAAARRRAEDRAADIARCRQCDDTGYIGRQLCDHDPARAEIAARGRAAVQAALKPNREAS